MSQVEVLCENLDKTYRLGEVDVPVLRQVNAEINRGELTVILGASGSGKSTLMNIIGGIDQPTAGRVFCGQEELTTMNDRRLTEFRRQNIGFVFQFYNLIPTLTAVENVAVSVQIADDAMNPLEALNLVGLADRKDHFPAQLSGGQQQRVSIARALAKKPKVMLCDEPTGALDFNTGRMVLELLTRLNEQTGTTIIIVTHASPISDLAHRVIHMTPEGIKTRVNETRTKAEEIVW